MHVRLLATALKNTTKSVLLLGPRQTGKSTLIASLCPDLEINLAHEPTFLEFSSDPGALESRLAARTVRTVFIDEVQRLPSLLNTVQVLLDLAKRRGIPLKFYLTGSSARKLKRGRANLLPGRLFSFELGPLVAAEIDHGMDVARALSIGCLPEPYSSPNEEATQILRHYAGTYLKEEIQSELFVRNLEGFARFLNAAAENSGRFLDFSKLARNAKVPRQSTVRYFEVLEDTLIARRVESFTEIKGSDVVKHPRYFFFDTGVLNGILGNFTVSADRKGFLFEHLVVSQIHTSARARDLDVELFSYRTRSGTEVDLIVRLAGDVWAIEVKASRDVHSGDLGGLRRFARDYRSKHQSAVVIPEGDDRKMDGVWVLSLRSLLKKMGL